MSSINSDQESWSETFARYGYYSYVPARLAGHCAERTTRSDELSIFSRIAYLGGALIFSCLTVPAFFIATPNFLMSQLSQKKVIVVKENKNVSDEIINEKVKVLFLNTASQSGMFPSITANMPSPYERFSQKHPSREGAIIEFVETTGANVVCASEAHDLASMNTLEKLLRGKGFTNFIKHPPTHFAFVNSGLFVASKKPISDAEMILYPSEIRSGVHYGAEQGCITFTVQETEKTIKIATTHLNFGPSKINQESRENQLKLVFDKLPTDQTTILGGDFNYKYMEDLSRLKGLSVSREIDSLLPEATQTTRVIFEEGEGTGRKKTELEVIDAAILVNGTKEDWEAQAIEPKVDGKYVTDHFGVLVTHKFSEQDQPSSSRL